MILAFFVYTLVLVLAFALYRNRRWLELSIISVPVLLCGYFLLSVGVFSFGEYMPFDYYRAGKKDAYGYVSVMVCLHFLAMVLAFLIVGQLSQKRSYERGGLQRLKGLGVGSIGAIACLIPAAFVVLAVPLSQLWSRNTFAFEGDTASLMRFADLTVFLSAIVIPFIRNRYQKYLVLFVVVCAFLAIGSRTAIAVLMTFFLTNVLVLQRMRPWVGVVIFFAAFWLLGTILLLRTYNSGGLQEVIEVALFGDYAEILSRMIYGTNYNFNLSFVLIAELLETVRVEAGWFYYSILPVPSAIYDQSAQYDAMNRFRKNIPYSGFGYALSFLGPWLYLGIVFVTSVIFLWVRNIVSVRRDIFEAIFCFLVFSIPSLILLQYNLRTGTRLIYFFVGLYILVALWRQGIFAPKRLRLVRTRA